MTPPAIVIQLDDYRKSPRWLTRHELTILQSYDPRFDGWNVSRIMSIVLEQIRHELNMHKYPKHNAQIIPINRRAQ